MEKIQIGAICRIHEDKLDEFKAVVEQLAAAAREKDTGTLQYDWFLSQDKTVCMVRETFTDSTAVLQHNANMGHLLRTLRGLADVSVEIFGDPSLELTAAIRPVAVYEYFQGLERG